MNNSQILTHKDNCISIDRYKLLSSRFGFFILQTFFVLLCFNFYISTYLRVYLELCGDRDLLCFSRRPSERCRLDEGEWLPRALFWCLLLEVLVELDVGLAYLPSSLKKAMMKQCCPTEGKIRSVLVHNTDA